MKRLNFLITIVYKSGVVTSLHCNNYDCALAYCEKLEKLNKHIKLTIDAVHDNNRNIYLYNTL